MVRRSRPLRKILAPVGALALLVIAACSGGDQGVAGPPDDAPLEISTLRLPAGTVGSTYSARLAATGGDGDFAWSVQAGALPPGLVLAASGSVTGTPTEAGSFDVTLNVTSAGQTSSRAFSIEVSFPSVSITRSALPSGSIRAAYSAALTAVGGDGTYSWSLTEGALPAGLSLALDGVISGTPTEVGTAPFTVAVASAGDTATRALSIEIGAPVVVIQTTDLPNGVVDQAYAATLIATGGDGTYEWAVQSGSLPPGLILAADGTISGTPTTVGNSDFVVQAVSVGSASTQALSIGIAASADARPAIISGTTPTVLIEGRTATIRGSGFDPDPSANAISLGGESLAVTAATETSLTVAVPEFDCRPPRSVPLRVIVGGLASEASVGVSPYEAGGADLAAGFYTYTLRGDGCIQLPQDMAGGEFLIGVTSVSESPAAVTPFRLEGTPGDADVFTSAPILQTSFSGAQTSGSGALGPDDGRPVGRLTDVPLRSATLGLREAMFGRSLSPDVFEDGGNEQTAEEQAAHLRMLEDSWRLMDDLGRPASLPRTVDASGGPEASAARGDTLDLSIFPDDGGGCSARPTVRAVVRFVGDNAVWLEDVASPDGTFTAEEFGELDAFYTDNVQSVHDEYFGSRSDIDANQRVLVLMSPKVNERGVLGYVWSGDLFPRSQCASSNGAEIFYGIVPDTLGQFGRARTRQEVLDLYPELTTHEITHIVQISERLFGSAIRKSIWETEGGATFAEQIVALPLFGHAAGDELGFEAWETGIQWYIEWTNGLVRHYGFQGRDNPQADGAPEECTWLGNEDQGNSGPCAGKVRAPYDVPSVFFRALLDRFGPTYPGGEAAMMKRLTQSPLRGWEAIGDVTGRPIEEDLAEFYMTLWGDGLIGDLPMMTTWDLFDVFSELVPGARLQPNLSSSPEFREFAAVRGGSSYYLYWTPSGRLAPTSLRVTSTSGTLTPGTVSVWVLRVQ